MRGSGHGGTLGSRINLLEVMKEKFKDLRDFDDDCDDRAEVLRRSSGAGNDGATGVMMGMVLRSDMENSDMNDEVIKGAKIKGMNPRRYWDDGVYKDWGD